MEKIIQINYQGRNISIEETAYNVFQQYEMELKAYFMKEDAGEETFADLQYRMSEILEQKNSSNGVAVSSADIHELIETIGKPSDLDSNGSEETREAPKQTSFEKKKLYRNKNKNEKVIAGVCSGIAHYFSIDPIAVRIVFVLFTVFNIATLLSFNIGILAYILFWVILEPVYIKTNIQRKLFRNPKDKVIGGVCSGLAQFFNSETWILRLIFLAPIVLGFVSSGLHFGKGFHFLGHSFTGLAVISYIILLIIVPVAKSSTDYMLLKGEPINISTIQKSISMNLVTESSNSGLNKFLKIIAYILIGMFLLFTIPIAISVLVGSIFSYNIADIILFSSFNKALAVFVILFFLALPLLSIIVWCIRRIAGYKKPNRPLRIGFFVLHVIGWFAAFLLVINLVKDNNTYISKPIKQDITVLSDTLFLQPLVPDSNYSENVIFEFNKFDRILQRTPDQNHIKAVRLKYKRSEDTSFHVVIEKSAFGRNRYIADENAMLADYETNLDGNNLYLASMVGVSNKVPYHFQNIKVTIYVPKNKTLIVSKELKKQLRHSIRTNNKNFYYHSESSKTVEENEVVIFDKDDDPSIITINDHTIRFDDDDEAKREANESLNEAQREAQQRIDEAKRELEESNRETQRQIEESKREAQQAIDEANRNLQESKREAQRKIDEANREAQQRIQEAKRSTTK